MFKLARIFTTLALGLILMSCSNPTDPPFDLYGSSEDVGIYADWLLLLIPDDDDGLKGRVNYLILLDSYGQVDELSTDYPGDLYIDGVPIALTYNGHYPSVEAQGFIQRTPNSVIQISFRDPKTQVVRHRSSLRLLDEVSDFCFSEPFQQFQDNYTSWTLDTNSPSQYLAVMKNYNYHMIEIPPSCRSYLLPWDTMQDYNQYPIHEIVLYQYDYKIVNRILYLSASSSYLDTESSSPQINQDKKPYLQLINSLERRIRKVNSEQ